MYFVPSRFFHPVCVFVTCVPIAIQMSGPACELGRDSRSMPCAIESGQAGCTLCGATVYSRRRPISGVGVCYALRDLVVGVSRALPLVSEGAPRYGVVDLGIKRLGVDLHFQRI